MKLHYAAMLRRPGAKIQLENDQNHQNNAHY